MDKGFTIDVLDKGFVRYIDHLGNDQRIVETARICYDAPSKGEEQDMKLLKYLYMNRHTSPFEAVNITYNIKMPIFVMRQFVRHRTFRLNEQSARYTEMKDEFYIPDGWRVQDTKNKQGGVESSELTQYLLNDHLVTHCRESYKFYQDLLSKNVAREMARMVLPVNLYTEVYVNCDIHNLMHFLRLRMDEHAQWEIRQYAIAMFKIMKELFPVTAYAFNNQVTIG